MSLGKPKLPNYTKHVNPKGTEHLVRGKQVIMRFRITSAKKTPVEGKPAIRNLHLQDVVLVEFIKNQGKSKSMNFERHLVF